MDITDIFETAKEQILKSGDHTPMIFAEEENRQLTLFALAVDFGDHITTHEKEAMFFSTGRKFAKEKTPLPTLKQLCFVSEAWISYVNKMEERKYRFPSDDPDREEALMVLSLDVPTMQHTLHMATMIRSKTGKLLELRPQPDMMQKSLKSDLLPSFLAGVLSAKYTDSEFSKWKKRLEH